MPKSKIKYRVEIFASEDGGFCSRLLHQNGKEVLRSSETYKNKTSAKKAFMNFYQYQGEVAVVDLTKSPKLNL